MAVGQEELEAFLPLFGLSTFRAGQKEVISWVMDGHDCLCVMPTGGGKSLCYQLPAVAREGLTLVVSPLIALMKDQVDALSACQIPAAFINSTLTPDEQADRLQRMAAGEYRLVYVVPERFRSPRFIEAVKASHVGLLAIDEAHCISQWGHDFRPDYAKLGRFRAQLSNPPTIALTATATDAVRRDIVELLNLQEPRTFITGFSRPNLFYEVQGPMTVRRKETVLLEFLAATPGAGIIYSTSRKRCEEVATAITTQAGRRAGVYHAGMLPNERREAQEAFMRGEHEIVVATTAFGMGIDKADVRFVVHYNLPGSLEAYYQEAGRAGRDGQPSRCLLLYNSGDRYIHEFFIESAYPARDVVQRVYDYLRALNDDPIELTQQQIKDTLGLTIGPDGVGNCEQLLEKVGVLERLERGQNLAGVRLKSDMPTLVDYLPQQAKLKRRVLRAVERFIGQRRHEIIYFHPQELLDVAEVDQPTLTHTLRELSSLDVFDYIPPFRGRAIRMIERQRPFEKLDIDFATIDSHRSDEYDKLDRVTAFAASRRCRQQEILKYFGESKSARCGHCDNCDSKTPGADAPTEPESVAPAVPRERKPSAAKPSVRTDVAQEQGSAAIEYSARFVEIVRMALSGIARAQGRFGKHAVAQMLCGSKSAKLTKAKLDRLSTFGLLSHLKQNDVVLLIDALISVGYADQEEVERFRPVMQLTQRGVEIMGGRAEIKARLPLEKDLILRLGAGTSSTGTPARVESSRVEPARPQLPKSLPPRSPEPPAAPAREYDFPEVDDTDESQWEPPPSSPLKPREPSKPEAPKVQATLLNLAPPDDPGAVKPSHYWTWRLLSGGYTPQDCAAIRNLEPAVILDHALRAADSGWKVEARWFLSPGTIALLEQAIGPTDPASIRPVLARVPTARYEEVQLFLKCRRIANS